MRHKVYWTKGLSMGKDIADYANKCVACQGNVFNQTPELMRMSKLPEHPRSQIAIDFYRTLTGEEI